MLLGQENQDDYFWADSAYSGKYFEDLLSPDGFETRIDEGSHAITLLATQQRGVLDL